MFCLLILESLRMQEGTSLRQPLPLTWQGGEMPARIPRLREPRLSEARALRAAAMPAAAASWPGAAASARPGRRVGCSRIRHSAWENTQVTCWVPSSCPRTRAARGAASSSLRNTLMRWRGRNCQGRGDIAALIFYVLYFKKPSVAEPGSRQGSQGRDGWVSTVTMPPAG